MALWQQESGSERREAQEVVSKGSQLQESRATFIAAAHRPGQYSKSQ